MLRAKSIDLKNSTKIRPWPCLAQSILHCFLDFVFLQFLGQHFFKRLAAFYASEDRHRYYGVLRFSSAQTTQATQKEGFLKHVASTIWTQCSFSVAQGELWALSAASGRAWGHHIRIHCRLSYGLFGQKSSYLASQSPFKQMPLPLRV